MSYSQNNEEDVIMRHFGDRKGCVLDLGANDGKTYSNSLAVIERGWDAVLVEPSPEAFRRLSALHDSRIKTGQVECHQVALAHVNGTLEFHESGEHIGAGDTSLLSTLVESEAQRWKRAATFTKSSVEAMTWDSFRQKTPRTIFNLVSIDIENMDYWVLTQMDLDAMGVEMLVIEDNQGNERAFTDYCKGFGLRKLTRNAENIIYIR